MFLQFPINYIVVTGGYTENHKAIDFGWFAAKPKTASQDIVAIADGVIYEKAYLSDGGNCVYTRHEGKDHTWYGGYMHLHRESRLAVGTKIKAGDKIGTMGATGRSHGNHLHFILWKVPKGHKLNILGDRNYRVNPLNHLKRLAHQEDRFNTFKIHERPKDVASGKVKVKKSAKTFDTGEKMDDWVKGSTFDVIQKGKNRTLVGRNGGVIGWVHNSDIEGAKVEAPKKPAKPSAPKSTKIGKYANFKGDVRLFIKAVGDECYPVIKGHAKKNFHTRVRPTSAKILEEKNGRVRVRVPRFNPQEVWIANSESQVTKNPLYKA